MADTGGDIIIKGGSCEIYFADSHYDTLNNNPGTRKHNDQSYKIRRIAISGDETWTKDFPDGFTGEIRIFCRSEALTAKK